MTDRDRLIKTLNDWARANNDCIEAESIADYLLANGVVKVVRCKDCKSSIAPDECSCFCNYFDKFVLLRDFCSFGELKEREG